MLIDPGIKLWPETLRGFVLNNPTRFIDVIVIVQHDHGDDEDAWLRNLRINDFGEAEGHRLDIIDAVPVGGTCKDILQLARLDAIEAIWFIHPKIYKTYVKIIRSFASILQSNTRLVNLSLAPSAELLPMPYRPLEPMNLATRTLAENGTLVLFAAGNGGPTQDSLNPWALAPWVVCVGAASIDGQRLAPFSARGRQNDPIYRPTIVAPGMELPMTFTSEDLPSLKEGDIEEYLANGTSFATPVACQTALQIIHYLENLRAELLATNDDVGQELTFAQIYAYEQGKLKDDRIINNRLAGTIDIGSGYRIAYYPVKPTPYVVKQILMDMAVEIPECESHEAGAGFVSPELALHCFGRYGHYCDVETSRHDVS